eukprot:COSAG02_NODE_7630_length_2925_cov_11.518401_2_plen_39_part_00
MKAGTNANEVHLHVSDNTDGELAIPYNVTTTLPVVREP